MIFGSLVLATLTTGLCVVLIVVSMVLSSRDHHGAGRMPVNEVQESLAAGVVQHAERRVVIAIGFTIAVFTAIASIGFAAPQLLGVPLAIAPGLAVSGALLLFAASVPPLASNPAINSAVLKRRHPWSFGPRWTFIAPLGIAAAFVAFLIVTGITSSPDSNGLYRGISVTDATTSSTASPYPGWFYGLPLMVVTVVLAMSTLLALRRVSATPSLPNTRLAPLDRHWREVSTLVITKLTTAALLSYFGGTAFIAGQATHNAATSFAATAGTAIREPDFAAGVTFQIIGGILALSGLAFFVAATFTAVSLRTRAQSVMHSDAMADRA
jgi:hypothetical protein